ncbi:MAG: VWA domain-containing protein [Acidobacteria bacterium]|nr:MAG: VWA domain-containing protein [Acidobacteriota bacterium]
MKIAIWIRELMSGSQFHMAVALVCATAGLSASALAVPAEAGVVPAVRGMSTPGVGEAPEGFGTGMLLWGPPGSRQPLPMLDLHVEIDITGLMVHGTVSQAFKNPTLETIEAVYVFPLPEKAAVHHMEIRIGERRIVSVIKEKEAARQTYQTARREGRKAALLEQERPNLFTIAVAGVNPGEEVHVRLEYVEELTYASGTFELVFPLTYSSRYGPSPSPGSDADHRSGQTILPAVAAPPRATLTVRLQAGLPLAEVTSKSHDIESRWDNEVLVIEAESGAPFAADRDFHLRFTPQVGHEPEAVLLVEDRDATRYALLMVFPPSHAPEMTGLATETLFVVDVSGSMSGPSMRQARAALAAAVKRLHPDDAFNILAFNDGVRVFADDYVAASEVEREQAYSWIQGLTAGGGTRIDLALEAALELVELHETWRVERIVFMTDGAVSTEDAVLERIRSRLGKARLHTLGIGAAPNRYLMRKMAEAGKGLCDFISRVDQAGNQIDLFLSRLSRPVMTDIELTWEGDVPPDTYPQRLPDLHAGEPLILSARFAPGAGQGRVVLSGRLAGGPIRRVLDLGGSPGHATGIATRWARHKAGDLMDSLHQGADPDLVRRDVIEVSRRFGIVTRYTSLVAVEEFPTADGVNLQIRVASAVPGRGQLPLGGTHEPLMRLVMMLCAIAAGVTGLVGHALRRGRPGRGT